VFITVTDIEGRKIGLNSRWIVSVRNTRDVAITTFHLASPISVRESFDEIMSLLAHDGWNANA